MVKLIGAAIRSGFEEEGAKYILSKDGAYWCTRLGLDQEALYREALRNYPLRGKSPHESLHGRAGQAYIELDPMPPLLEPEPRCCQWCHEPIPWEPRDFESTKDRAQRVRRYEARQYCSTKCRVEGFKHLGLYTRNSKWQTRHIPYKKDQL